VAAVSGTTTPGRLAEKAFKLLKLPPKGEIAISFVAHLIIYPGTKIRHFEELQSTTGLAYSDMLFFDTDASNTEVETLGVTFVSVGLGIDGLTRVIFEKGIEKWRRRLQFDKDSVVIDTDLVITSISRSKTESGYSTSTDHSKHRNNERGPLPPSTYGHDRIGGDVIPLPSGSSKANWILEIRQNSTQETARVVFTFKWSLQHYFACARAVQGTPSRRLFCSHSSWSTSPSTEFIDIAACDDSRACIAS
jgi:Acid Phosphatase